MHPTTHPRLAKPQRCRSRRVLGPIDLDRQTGPQSAKKPAVFPSPRKLGSMPHDYYLSNPPLHPTVHYCVLLCICTPYILHHEDYLQIAAACSLQPWTYCTPYCSLLAASWPRTSPRFTQPPSPRVGGLYLNYYYYSRHNSRFLYYYFCTAKAPSSGPPILRHT